MMTNSAVVSRFVTRASKDLSQRAHRRLIGFLGILLPVLLYGVAELRPTEGLDRWRLLPSVSAYYYTGAVGIFVGVLFALSLFLLTYRGYEGEVADRVIGSLGGFAALGVALFPTAAPTGAREPSWWSTPLRTVHYVSAVVLFLAFIVFAMWLFRKSSLPRKEDRGFEKRWRNTVYLICGISMILSVLWAASSLITHADIFWPETIAIIAFAVSWLVKGEADLPVRRAIRRLAPRIAEPSDRREGEAA
jgi:heme/copper-type cytochrome/quinol oxidase subunit 2